MKKTNKYKVCVIGPRKLEASMLVEYFDKINELFINLINENSTKEIIVVSTLAEGADRLIVSVALKLGLRYNVLLPMKRKYYQKDFDDESYKEFNFMLTNSRGCNVIPLHEGNTELLITSYGEHRDYQYSNVELELVKMSDSIIFIFNDTFNKKIRVISDIVKYAKESNKFCHNIY